MEEPETEPARNNYPVLIGAGRAAEVGWDTPGAAIEKRVGVVPDKQKAVGVAPNLDKQDFPEADWAG